MKAIFIEPVKEFIGFIFVTLVSFVGCHDSSYVVNNTNKEKSLDLITNVIEYKTEIKYNDSLKKGTQNILVEGQDGYAIVNEQTDKIMYEKTATNEVIEEGTYEEPVIINNLSLLPTLKSYNGKITQYNCSETSSACHTATGHNLRDSVIYHDSTYGDLRILSAASTEFPKGTLVEVIGSKMGTFYGIVLDTGGDMNAAWNKQEYAWMDVAIDLNSESQYANITATNITYNVKRYGW